MKMSRLESRSHLRDSHAAYEKIEALEGERRAKKLPAGLMLTLAAIFLLAAAHAAHCTPVAVVSGEKRTNQAPETVSRQKRAATARQDRLWEDAVIPYEIDPVFSDERAALFRSAMRHWENYTCVKFVERQPDEHRNYIVFTERSCGCCSFVGKRGNGAQAISIGKHCDKFGIVVHELGHVVGFWHEHTRPDRDQHVQIIGKNIMSGQEYNFNKLTKDEVNSLGLAYDYDSILHYATNTFAKDTYLDTILPLHEHLNTEVVTPPNLVIGQSASTVNQTSTSSTTISQTSSPTLAQLHANKSTGPSVISMGQDAHSSNKIVTNPSGSPMINDQPRALNLSIQEQLENAFNSMLHFESISSKKKASTKNRVDFRESAPRIMLIDGSVVVSITKRESQNSGTRRSRRGAQVDVDDGRHMLAMDNLLATKTRPEIGQRVRLSVGDIAQTNLLYKCPKCGKTIQQTSGWFHSSNYYLRAHDNAGFRGAQPEDDSESEQPDTGKEFCEWRLSAGPGERILINITDLDLAGPSETFEVQESTRIMGMPRAGLSEHELIDIVSQQTASNKNYLSSDPLIMLNCASDYIEIRDGYTLRAPLVAKLCGHISSLRDIMRPIVSTNNRMLVTMRTSSRSINKRGFLAQHDTVCGGQIMLGNVFYNEPQTSTLVVNQKTISVNTVQYKSNIGPDKPAVETVSVSTISTTSNTSTVASSTPVTSSSLINRLMTNASYPSENEVLLSSQTNLRYSNLQSQQPSTNLTNEATTMESTTSQQSDGSTAATILLPSTPISIQSHSAESSKRGKLFDWSQWPPLNSSIIQTPNWPEHYRPSKECLWQVKADENHQISLRFDSFDLESHDSCAYDYVEVRDGDNLNSELIGRFCGNRIPDQILSSSGSMIIKFVSDSDVNRGGFLASLQPELDECKLGTHGCSYRCSNAAVPYRCECPVGLELAPDGRNCVPTCGGVRNESSGQISSPAFPDLYPTSTRCIWDIFAPAHHRITLNFTHFDLEGIKAQECDYDYVDIRSKTLDGKYVKNGIFCGPNQGFMVTSIANVMRIEFNSDNSIQKSGFLANYFIDRDECATNNGGCQHICTNTIGSYQCSCNNGFILNENKHDCLEGHCTYSISAPDGTFHSPNFPNNYQPNKECAWIFSTAPGHRIRLIFDQFDLESHQECAYDHVAVFDGESVEGPALGRFCGSRRPLTLVSSFNMLYLLFRSDATNEKRGFNASHSTACGGRLQANLNHEERIYSHPSFDGVTHYSRNEDCDWLIEANFNQRVRIEFTFFALEPDSNCNYDQVIVYDGTDDRAKPLARLCGSDIPKDQTKVTSSGESMLIVFRTDDSINHKGFSLTYTAIESNEE